MSMLLGTIKLFDFLNQNPLSRLPRNERIKNEKYFDKQKTENAEFPPPQSLQNAINVYGNARVHLIVGAQRRASLYQNQIYVCRHRAYSHTY